jgi:hypothetical protein
MQNLKAIIFCCFIFVGCSSAIPDLSRELTMNDLKVKIDYYATETFSDKKDADKNRLMDWVSSGNFVISITRNKSISIFKYHGIRIRFYWLKIMKFSQKHLALQDSDLLFLSFDSGISWKMVDLYGFVKESQENCVFGDYSFMGKIGYLSYTCEGTSSSFHLYTSDFGKTWRSNP